MKKTLFLVVILATAALLRFYQLGSNPPSLDWDETSLGYNAYSLLKSGSDEYGNSWPLSIRSFDDYKPPAYTYATIPSIALFGLTEFAVRLPSAIAGLVAVAFTYFLVLELFPNHSSKQPLALSAAFLLAISPWHLQFSRAAFEANLALTFYILAIFFFLKWTNTLPKTSKKAPLHAKTSLLWITSSAICAAAALYSYHSARLAVPFMFLGLAYTYRRRLLTRSRQLIPALLIGFLLVSPLLLLLLRGSASSRFTTTSVFTNPGEFSRERERLDRISTYRTQHTNLLNYLHTQKSVYAKIIARNYFEHFNFDFLFLRADGNARHHAVGMGLLYLSEFPLLLYGSYHLARSRSRHKYVVWLWLLVGPSAAALTASTPHAIRSLLLLPSFQILIAFGAVTFYQNHLTQKKLFPVLLIIGYLLLASVNIFFYLNLYYVITPYQISHDWQYGYKQLVSRLQSLESGYDRIYVTTYYDQPHIYFAFYGPIPPPQYQVSAETASSQIGKIHFKSIDSGDFAVPNTLLAVEPDRTPSQATIIDQIKFLNGDTAFNLISTGPR